MCAWGHDFNLKSDEASTRDYSPSLHRRTDKNNENNVKARMMMMMMIHMDCGL